MFCYASSRNKRISNNDGSNSAVIIAYQCLSYAFIADFAAESISLMRFNWFTSDAPGS